MDGIFATSDIIAAFAVKGCMKAGKRVPEDVRIVGYDDVSAATWLTPEITSIRLTDRRDRPAGGGADPQAGRGRSFRYGESAAC
ncbi:substrate-binding domain-containing protein [Paenibacillus sp. P26]|nr:substrate-binding domain-containing protein [Paenibacillus sp. P26]